VGPTSVSCFSPSACCLICRFLSFGSALHDAEAIETVEFCEDWSYYKGFFEFDDDPPGPLDIVGDLPSPFPFIFATYDDIV